MKKKGKKEYVDPILYEMGILKKGEGLGRFLENGKVYLITNNLSNTSSNRKNRKR
ncbi:MAG: hypothetical protein U0U66_13135 [Cytophagaceae bacterium]